MNYTKGEWKASKTHNFTGTLVSYITSGDKTIAQTRLNDSNSAIKENEANAQLISSAPLFYEALKEVCRRYDEDGILDISPARQALAKAEGKNE